MISRNKSSKFRIRNIKYKIQLRCLKKSINNFVIKCKNATSSYYFWNYKIFPVKYTFSPLNLPRTLIFFFSSSLACSVSASASPFLQPSFFSNWIVTAENLSASYLSLIRKFVNQIKKGNKILISMPCEFSMQKLFWHLVSYFRQI